MAIYLHVVSKLSIGGLDWCTSRVVAVHVWGAYVCDACTVCGPLMHIFTHSCHDVFLVQPWLTQGAAAVIGFYLIRCQHIHLGVVSISQFLIQHSDCYTKPAPLHVRSLWIGLKKGTWAFIQWLFSLPYIQNLLWSLWGPKQKWFAGQFYHNLWRWGDRGCQQPSEAFWKGLRCILNYWIHIFKIRKSKYWFMQHVGGMAWHSG